MADGTHIEWTDATWNIVTGCSVVSPGCTNCYAMRLAGTRLRDHPSRQGLTVASKAGPVWNGQVRFNAEWLAQPLRWAKPRRIFVAAHGDLFHEEVPFGWVMRILEVMYRTPQHTYQILTKRPDRMREFFRLWSDVNEAEDWDFKGAQGPEAVRAAHSSGRGQLFADMLEAMGKPPPGCAYPFFDWAGGMSRYEDVLPNVWLGVSVEDQARANEQIPLLLETPAAVRWISAEPLLGPVSIAEWLESWCASCRRPLIGGGHFVGRACGTCHDITARLDWVVAGGESGAGARPMHPDWARQLRDQCAAAGVPFLFKQWGDHAPEAHDHGVSPDACYDPWGEPRWPGLALGIDGVVAPSAEAAAAPHAFLRRCGKRAAGRLLDGVLHDAFPEARHV